MFTILKRDEHTRARLGFLETPHGGVETPAYVMVGTHAEVRCLTPSDVQNTRTQMVIANTYHLWQSLGETLTAFEGVHARLGWHGPMMTDSGGFQVFSLGFGREHGVGKIAFPSPDGAKREVYRPEQNLVSVSDDGVTFIAGGERIFLDARLSIKIQEHLGADIIVAFDECTSPFHDHDYNAQALRRTHAWATQCLIAKKRTDQKIYGVVQGGAFRDLREESARAIGAMPFDGIAIGGSFGRKEMKDVLEWTVPLLPAKKPRHLLGIGRIEDIFEGVERGIDTFDCVIPTREARHGSLWTMRGRFDIRKGAYANNFDSLCEGCVCPACTAPAMRKKDLHELFKSKNPEAGRVATIHNVYFFNDVMRHIRMAIYSSSFQKLKDAYYTKALR